MTDQNVDIAILGTGPAGSRVASLCADTQSVAMIESRAPGGTCALRGCNPKKVLVRAAELNDWMNRAPFRAGAAKEALCWQELQRFKCEFVDPVPAKTRRRLKKQGVALIEGTGRFMDPTTLEVDGVTVRARNVVVATGACPVPLSMPGSQHIISSDDFLNLPELPRRILFVGGGFISFEFAHIAARAGAECTIIDRGPRPLRRFDEELVARLVDYTDSLSVAVQSDTTLESVCATGNSLFEVKVRDASGVSQILEVDLVVHGAGRVPDVKDLALDQAGVQWGPAGIAVNAYQQSVSNPRVYAAGDVADTGEAMLSPVANQEGRIIAKNLLEGPTHTADYGVVPSVLYTVPPLAAVGMTVAEARAQGRSVRVLEGDRSGWASMRKLSAPCSAYRIVVDEESDRLLGAHLLGPDAAETINLFALAMKFGHTAKEVKSVLFAFPTCSSDVRSML